MPTSLGIHQIGNIPNIQYARPVMSGSGHAVGFASFYDGINPFDYVYPGISPISNNTTQGAELPDGYIPTTSFDLETIPYYMWQTGEAWRGLWWQWSLDPPVLWLDYPVTTAVSIPLYLEDENYAFLDQFLGTRFNPVHNRVVVAGLYLQVTPEYITDVCVRLFSVDLNTGSVSVVYPRIFSRTLTPNFGHDILNWGDCFCVTPDGATWVIPMTGYTGSPPSRVAVPGPITRISSSGGVTTYPHANWLPGTNIAPLPNGNILYRDDVNPATVFELSPSGAIEPNSAEAAQTLTSSGATYINTQNTSCDLHYVGNVLTCGFQPYTVVWAEGYSSEIPPLRQKQRSDSFITPRSRGATFNQPVSVQEGPRVGNGNIYLSTKRRKELTVATSC